MRWSLWPRRPGRSVVEATRSAVLVVIDGLVGQFLAERLAREVAVEQLADCGLPDVCDPLRLGRADTVGEEHGGLGVPVLLGEASEFGGGLDVGAGRQVLGLARDSGDAVLVHEVRDELLGGSGLPRL